MSDPHLGKLTYIRLYSGTLETGTSVLNSTKGRKERIGKIFQMHANKREEKPSAVAGMIVAVMGLKDTTTGDTLCDNSKPVILESMTFPAPVIRSRSSRRARPTRKNLARAIQRLAEEDPTFQVRSDEETGQTIIAGMGELHLEVLVDRMKREFRVEANVGRPQVAYRETIPPWSIGIDYTHKKQTGGSASSRRSRSRWSPSATAASRLRVRQQDHRWTHPARVHPQRGRWCQEAMEYGVLAGYPMVGVKVTLKDGATTTSTPQSWPSRSPVRWRSRKVPRGPNRFCWSR